MAYKDSIKSVAKKIPVNKGNVLVTGATGLIGSCLIDVLLASNEFFGSKFKIYALSRSEERLIKRFGNSVVPVVQDIVKPLDKNMVYDYVFHAASNADPVKYATNPVETMLTNLMGNQNVLEYCRYHKNTRMLLTSTFEVYGRIENVDVYTEDMSGTVDIHILRNGYTESKRCAEMLLRSYVDEYETDAVIARLSSIYGPTMLFNDSKAHAQFIRNALKKENIVLKSEGLQRRTYCYVIDAVSGILCIMFNGKTGEAYNVANEKSVASISEFANICAQLAGTKVIFSQPEKLEEKGFSKPQNCILDNSKLRSLEWAGKYSLKEGIEETIEELKQQHTY